MGGYVKTLFILVTCSAEIVALQFKTSISFSTSTVQIEDHSMAHRSPIFRGSLLIFVGEVRLYNLSMINDMNQSIQLHCYSRLRVDD